MLRIFTDDLKKSEFHLAHTLYDRKLCVSSPMTTVSQHHLWALLDQVKYIDGIIHSDLVEYLYFVRSCSNV